MLVYAIPQRKANKRKNQNTHKKNNNYTETKDGMGTNVLPKAKKNVEQIYMKNTPTLPSYA